MNFFIEDAAIQQLCLDNAISYTTSQSNDGETNLTYLMIPDPQEETANRIIIRVPEVQVPLPLPLPLPLSLTIKSRVSEKCTF